MIKSADKRAEGAADRGAAKKALAQLTSELAACRHCLMSPQGVPLPHTPRPVFVASQQARICIIGQAPGTKVHASGKPFTDRSGDRLRDWIGISCEQFYDARKLAIIPMGFCFPGQNNKGADLPPRRECAPLWHDQLFELMPQIELILLVGLYAQKRYLTDSKRQNLTQNVRDWRDRLEPSTGPVYLPMPHPSWRNNGWLRKNPFFERDLLPFLRTKIVQLLAKV